MSAGQPAHFRQFVPPKDHPRIVGLSDIDAESWAARTQQMPQIQKMVGDWKQLAAEPFCGITADGKRVGGLYALEDNGAPTEAMLASAQALLSKLSPAQRDLVLFPFDAPEKRYWTNPEMLVFNNGLRMEDCSEEIRLAILAVLESSLSSKGYAKATNCIRINHFLGELCHCHGIMNQYSYNFLIFGEPSMTRPWAWSIYGHHLCLHVFFHGGHMSISPTFMGAEPNYIDEGPWQGTRVFEDEEKYGTELIQSLMPAQLSQAQSYNSMTQVPAHRVHRFDGLHMAGAFQDNRIIPYEGLLASTLSTDQQGLLLNAISGFLEYLPEPALSSRLSQIKSHFSSTYFSFIGSTEQDAPFYYRIQSPVVSLELAHQPGIWLLNKEPARFHVHTIARMPNGGDYGVAVTAGDTAGSNVADEKERRSSQL